MTHWDPDNTMGFTTSAFDLRLQAELLQALLLKLYRTLIKAKSVNFSHSILMPGH